MLTIRLSRTGKRHKPQYRIVLQEKGRDPWSPAIEILGHYNPHTQPSTVALKEERIKHWIGQGAQPSETVHNMLVNAEVIKGDKAKSVTISKKRAGKLEEKASEAKEAKAAAAEKAKTDKETADAKAKEEKEAAEEEKKAKKVEEEAEKKASEETKEVEETKEEAKPEVEEVKEEKSE